jgi:hypothetical protein
MYTYSLKLHGPVRSCAGLVVVVVLLSLPFSKGGSFSACRVISEYRGDICGFFLTAFSRCDAKASTT